MYQRRGINVSRNSIASEQSYTGNKVVNTRRRFLSEELAASRHRILLSDRLVGDNGGVRSSNRSRTKSDCNCPLWRQDIQKNNQSLAQTFHKYQQKITGRRIEPYSFFQSLWRPMRKINLRQVLHWKGKQVSVKDQEMRWFFVKKAKQAICFLPGPP